jgi:hypothetical protein
MKKDILKIAGVKSEKEFYKKYPTEEAFKKAFPKEFKKAAMGASMVKKQLNQLTDFGNPPQAQVGTYIGGEQSSYKPLNYTELRDQANYANTGVNREMMMQDQNLAAQQTIAANSKKGGIMDMFGQIAPQLDSLSPDAVGGMRRGGYVRKAQNGLISMPDFTKADQTINKQFKFDNTKFGQSLGKFNQGAQKFGKGVGAGYDKLDSSLGNIGGVSGALSAGTDLIDGFQQLKQEKNQKRQAKQSFQLSGLTKDVAGLTPDIAQRKYVRPEDQAFGTQEMGQAYGAGAGNPFLQAEYGARIGGNPTEIQNMYNPGDIYSDMGYEPLSDSEIVKQYRRGGLIPKAQLGMDKMAGQAGGSLGSLIGGGKGRPTAGGKIGSTIGSTAGNLILPGVGGIIGGALGGLVGGAFGGKSAAETARYEEGTQQNTDAAAFMSGTQGIRAQNAAYMEDGGWVSHNWQPQVITQFGGYDLKDLLKSPEDADMLRAGGHLKNYTAPSARAMSTERPDFAMGGQLNTTWGGYAEPVSQNPYLPGSGETVMFRGKSHDESDGNGHTGIGVKYGQGAKDSYTDYAEYGTNQADADVEVERGEPAVELPDAETGDVSMVVYGNMQIPSYGASELGDAKAKGKKFKNYANDLSKMEAKQNKTVEKGLKLIDSVDSDNPYDLLKLNAGKAMVEGANMQLKGLAIQKQRLAGIQNAILDTAGERGLDSDSLAKGKIKKASASDMAKFGAKLETAQKGKKLSANLDRPSFMDPISFPKPSLGYTPMGLPDSRVEGALPESIYETVGQDRYYDMLPPKINPMYGTPVDSIPGAAEIVIDETKDKFDFMDLVRQAQPYLTPSNQMGLEAAQLMPEMLALATNQLEPVQAQTFEPLLEQPYSISLQDQLNANQADFNAMQRLMGYNPAAASALAAQKYAANSAILGQQARLNQEMQMGAYNRNRAVLNDATLKNLAILDQQYGRQAQAKSATKAQAQAALSSIADKIAKNKLENRTLGVYENMYNYRFGPKGRAYNTNPLAKFNIDMDSVTSEELEILKKAKEIQEKKSSKKDSSDKKNGGIVKAIKNL